MRWKRERRTGLWDYTKARRTKADIARIREAMYSLLARENPMTVRQVFYRLVSQGVIGKTESEYKATVCRLLGEMRLQHEIPFGWIADNTRWMRKPRTDSSMAAALRRTAEAYRRSLWDNQSVYVEVWLEKDALAGVLYEETAPWDVPLMVTRGYPSLSYLHEAAESLPEEKPAYLYYLGDYDPSGMDISRVVEERMEEFAPLAEIHFERIAVTPEQIHMWHLPTRPTKASDSRSKGFADASVEVDAIPPGQLRELVQQSITQHVDQHALDQLRMVEREERTALRLIVADLERDDDEDED